MHLLMGHKKRYCWLNNDSSWALSSSGSLHITDDYGCYIGCLIATFWCTLKVAYLLQFLPITDSTVPCLSASLYFSHISSGAKLCQQLVTWKHKRKAESLFHCILRQTTRMTIVRELSSHTMRLFEGSRPSASPWAREGRLAWVTYWFLSPLRKSWLIPVKAIGLLNRINSIPRHLAW